MATRLNIRTSELIRLVNGKAEAGLRAAGFELYRLSLKAASVRNQPQQIPVRRVVPGGNATSRTIYPHPARPGRYPGDPSGQPPRQRTGFGRKNIGWGFSSQRMAARIGHGRNARYMAMHEVGINYPGSGYQQRATISPMAKLNKRRLAQVFENAAKR